VWFHLLLVYTLGLHCGASWLLLVVVRELFLSSLILCVFLSKAANLQAPIAAAAHNNQAPGNNNNGFVGGRFFGPRGHFGNATHPKERNKKERKDLKCAEKAYAPFEFLSFIDHAYCWSEGLCLRVAMIVSILLLCLFVLFF
jgi:hypothetical protein